MYNFRTEEEVEMSPEEMDCITAEQGREFVPRINLGPEMEGSNGPAVGLYDVLILQGVKPIDAIEDVLRTLTGGRTERKV